MDDQEIEKQLAAVRAETDVLGKHLRTASLVGALFREHGHETVVVGGSGIVYLVGRLVMLLINVRPPNPATAFAAPGATPKDTGDVVTELEAVLAAL